MSTNRDDFAIAVRSALLQRGARQKFSLFALIIASILILILDNTQINSNKLNKDKKIKNAINRFILSVSENGYGKRSSYLDYRVTNRGGKGIIGIINSPRNGNIASSLVVNDDDEIILSTDKGSIMRCAVKEIRIAGRNTQGVRIKKLSGTEKVVSVIKIVDNII